MSIPYVRFGKDDDSVVRALEGLQEALLRHPIAAQAAFAALVAEGRRFAQTPEGADWAKKLEGSELLDRLRLVWENISLTAFVDEPSDALPSFFVDGLVKAASLDGVEALLSKLIERR